MPDKKYRIGIIKDATHNIMPAVRDNFEQSLKVLAKSCEIVDAVAFPSMPFGQTVGTIISAEGASAFRDWIEAGRLRELRTSEMHPAACAATMLSAVDYLQAMRLRTKMQKTLAELYGKYDALVAPALPTVSYPIAHNFNESYKEFGRGLPIIQAGNLAGQPALAVPNGFGPNNLPTGIQFTGKVWSEARLLAIAHAYQQATDWHTRRPKI
jgi:aspartyl-tRNA(Asn)/glutamyl-tRNA(Gln) amidotransferase subunit A